MGARLGDLEYFKLRTEAGFREVAGLIGLNSAGVDRSSILTGRGRVAATPLSADMFLTREP